MLLMYLFLFFHFYFPWHVCNLLNITWPLNVLLLSVYKQFGCSTVLDNFPPWSFSIWCLIFRIVTGGNPDAKRLYDDLLSNYNKLVRPVVNVSDALTVRIKLKLSQLIDVNLKNQIMTTNLWVEQSVSRFNIICILMFLKSLIFLSYFPYPITITNPFIITDPFSWIQWYDYKLRFV